MEESRVRTLILEEIQGIISQVSEETKGNYNPMVVAKSISEIIGKRLDGVKDKRETENEENFDTEIGKDPV